MIRQAGTSDLPAMEAFLNTHIEGSMFLLSNLRDHGLSGSDHDKATTYWLAEQDDGICAVFGHSRSGYLLVSTAGFDPAWTPSLKAVLAGRHLVGTSGRSPDIDATTRALGLDAVVPGFSEQQPLYSLSLPDLILPGGDTGIRAMEPDDLDRVADWRLAFDQEIFGDGDSPEGRKRSALRAKELIETGRGHILHRDGEPVAMTAFNAVLPEVVQIGSVYTPPANRGRGYARRAVALHLAEAVERGVQTAILFSAGPAANRAYESIGFVQIGHFTLIDYAPPVTIGGFT